MWTLALLLQYREFVENEKSVTYINVVAQLAAAEHQECFGAGKFQLKKRWKCNKTICPMSDRSHLCANLRCCTI